MELYTRKRLQGLGCAFPNSCTVACTPIAAVFMAQQQQQQQAAQLAALMLDMQRRLQALEHQRREQHFVFI